MEFDFKVELADDITTLSSQFPLLLLYQLFGNLHTLSIHFVFNNITVVEIQIL